MVALWCDAACCALSVLRVSDPGDTEVPFWVDFAIGLEHIGMLCADSFVTVGALEG